ncbi:MAG TPA: aspartate--tRNA(Asn) ligase [Candidatus Bipolaricaulota bacterium]|nr:aspartate--tRNA(Asn) ligase [Candidatus Bipolaricaulota bacterium]
MARTLNLEVVNKKGEEVIINGWVDVRRNMGKIVFLDMRDRTGILQVVLVPNELDDASKGILDNIRPQFVLEIQGVVNERKGKNANPLMESGSVEVLAKSIKVLAEAETLPYELGSEMKMDTYLDNAPLNYRDEKSRAVFKVQSALIQGFRELMIDEGFTEFQAPKLVAEATEGGANVFKIDYFGKAAYLGQSPQFYKQIMTGVFERVFTCGNVYRAEAHHTSRHVNEYTSLDFEMGFIKDHSDVMDMTRRALTAMMNKVAKTCDKEVQLLDAAIPEVPAAIPSMKLKEAEKILKDEFGENCEGEPDLEPHQEELICQYAKRKFDSDFLFITHYPVEKRPMYTMPDENDKGFTKSFDLLFRGCEIVTGGQRIHDYQMLVENIKKFKMDPKEFEFYLEAFKYGMPPEGGIGMGLERVTQKLLGLDNIKQATLFPRDDVRIDLPLSGK